MIRFLGPGTRLCDGWRRREILRVGGLGLLGGLDLAGLARGADVARSTGGPLPGRAKSCIVLFLMGGPPQQSTWDPKPDAPADVRGEFKPIATKVPGLSISELLPKTAAVADKLCLLRAVSTGDNAHSSSGYYMLTGQPHSPMNMENANPGPPNDSPVLGGLLGRVSPPRPGMPASVTLPHRIFNTDGSVWPGQDAGYIGRTFDPWLLNAKQTPEGYRVQEIALPADLDHDRLGRRKDLLDRLPSAASTRSATTASPACSTTASRQAFELLGSSKARRAFRLEDEPEAVRSRYGETPFGRGVLLSRRLVEAGVRLVQVNWYRGADEPPANPCWDSHTQEAARLKNVLVPPTDQAFSALVEDLSRRGLLDETLVVCMAEFGRSPRLDGNGGRNHWGSVFSVAMARRQRHSRRPGLRLVRQDRAPIPATGKVRPEDLLATRSSTASAWPGHRIPRPLGRPAPDQPGRGDPGHPVGWASPTIRDEYRRRRAVPTLRGQSVVAIPRARR